METEYLVMLLRKEYWANQWLTQYGLFNYHRYHFYSNLVYEIRQELWKNKFLVQIGYYHVFFDICNEICKFWTRGLLTENEAIALLNGENA